MQAGLMMLLSELLCTLASSCERPEGQDKGGVGIDCVGLCAF